MITHQVYRKLFLMINTWEKMNQKIYLSRICFVGITLVSILGAVAFIFRYRLCAVHFYPGCKEKKSPQTTPKILIVADTMDKGGALNATLNTYRTLHKRGCNVSYLTPFNAVEIDALRAEKLSFYTYHPFKMSYRSWCWRPGLQAAVAHIYQTQGIDIIHGSSICELQAVKKGAPSAKVILTYHDSHHLVRRVQDLCYADGIIDVSPYLFAAQAYQGLQIPRIPSMHLPPFYDAEPYLSYKPQQTKQEFFLQTFNLVIADDLPIVTMIANFYKDTYNNITKRFESKHKNYPLLFRAIERLIHQYNKPMHVMLAGSGPMLETYKKLINEMHLDNYVHFLGYSDCMPELLFFSDVQVLTSKNEAFAIALLEGALMKKPLIVSDAVGAVGTLIKHQQTGLVFKNDDVDDLIDNMLYLLNNPLPCKQLGQDAYRVACTHFTPDALATHLIDFYQRVLGQSSDMQTS